MKYNPMKWLAIATVITMLAACGEEELAPITVSAQEFVMTIEENPEEGATIGSIIATTNRGSLGYEMMSQDPANALVVDGVTGEITVGDASLFDFEEREFVTAMITVFNEDKEDVIIARVNITDGLDNPRADALVAYYPLDVEATDLSSFANHGTVDGAIPVTNSQGFPGGALQFDGDNDRVTVPHADQLNVSDGATFSAMVNPTVMKSGDIVRKGANVNGTARTPYALSLSANGKVLFTLNDTDGVNQYQLGEPSYALNEWIMVTGVKQGEEMLLYINGQLMDQVVAPGNINTNGSPLYIGSRTATLGNTFGGAIDDVRIYDAALTAKEIEELYGNYFL